MTRLAVRMGRPRAVLHQGVAALALVVPVAGCTNSPHLAGGPIVVGPEPVRVEFHEAVPVLGPTWELCLEFDRPRDSHGARSIDAVLIDTEGGRVPLGSPKLDRRGEAAVCLIARLSDARVGRTVSAVELRSKKPVRLRGLRGGSLPTD